MIESENATISRCKSVFLRVADVFDVLIWLFGRRGCSLEPSLKRFVAAGLSEVRMHGMGMRLVQ